MRKRRFNFKKEAARKQLAQVLFWFATAGASAVCALGYAEDSPLLFLVGVLAGLVNGACAVLVMAYEEDP